FDMLEVALDAEEEEVKDNYIRLLKAFHPDRVEPLKDEKLKRGFEKISAKLKESKAVLSNAEERDKYVRFLKGEDDREEEEQEIVRSVLTDELAYQKVLVFMNKRKFEGVVELMEPIYKKGTSNGEYIAAYAWAKVALSTRGATNKEYIDLLKKALELSPRSERVNFWLGCALQKAGFVMGEWEQYMRATVEINPHNIEAQRQLHIIELKTKKDKKSALGGLGDIRKSFIGSKISGFLKKKKEDKKK
ncbi:MAG: DnaJ domain-containing protein, partial [Pseudomonadota bacterium]